MSSSEDSQTDEKNEVFSDSSDGNQEEYSNNYDDSDYSERDKQNNKSYFPSQESSRNNKDNELNHIRDNTIKNLIKSPINLDQSEDEKHEINTQTNFNTRRIINNENNDFKNDGTVYNEKEENQTTKDDIDKENPNINTDPKRIDDFNKTGSIKPNSSISNTSNTYSSNDEIHTGDIGCSGIYNKENNFPSFNQYSRVNFEEKGLQPKLPPLHDIKTVGQHGPTTQSPRPQIYSVSPAISSNNNSPRIIPPPQRRRSPITRRRQINTPRDRNSFRRNYDILKPDPPTDEENALIKRILKGEVINFDPNDPNSLNLINTLIVHLQQLRKQKAIERNYKDGLKLNKAITTLEQQRTEIMIKMNQSESKKLLDNEYNKFKKRKEEFDNETKEMINELQSKQTWQRENMKKTHEEKEQRLFYDWTQGKQIKMYNRSSNELTSLRRQHAFLLVQNKFEEAQKISQEIEQKQFEEMENSHLEHQKDYDSAYDFIKEKIKEEYNFYENKCSIVKVDIMD